MPPAVPYLESFVEQAKAYLPSWMIDKIHARARGHAGGKGYPNPTDYVGTLTEMATVSPLSLKSYDDERLDIMHTTVHKLYENAVKNNRKPAPYVNAHKFVQGELSSRNRQHELTSRLDKLSAGEAAMSEELEFGGPGSGPRPKAGTIRSEAGYKIVTAKTDSYGAPKICANCANARGELPHGEKSKAITHGSKAVAGLGYIPASYDKSGRRKITKSEGKTHITSYSHISHFDND